MGAAAQCEPLARFRLTVGPLSRDASHAVRDLILQAYTEAEVTEAEPAAAE